jgi:hypothetical protein
MPDLRFWRRKIGLSAIAPEQRLGIAVDIEQVYAYTPVVTAEDLERWYRSVVVIQSSKVRPMSREAALALIQEAITCGRTGIATAGPSRSCELSTTNSLRVQPG